VTEPGSDGFHELEFTRLQLRKAQLLVEEVAEATAVDRVVAGVLDQLVASPTQWQQLRAQRRQLVCTAVGTSLAELSDICTQLDASAVQEKAVGAWTDLRPQHASAVCSALSGGDASVAADWEIVNLPPTSSLAVLRAIREGRFAGTIQLPVVSGPPRKNIGLVALLCAQKLSQINPPHSASALRAAAHHATASPSPKSELAARSEEACYLTLAQQQAKHERDLQRLHRLVDLEFRTHSAMTEQPVQLVLFEAALLVARVQDDGTREFDRLIELCFVDSVTGCDWNDAFFLRITVLTPAPLDPADAPITRPSSPPPRTGQSSPGVSSHFFSDSPASISPAAENVLPFRYLLLTFRLLSEEERNSFKVRLVDALTVLRRNIASVLSEKIHH
jgi:hypothetical protein